MIPHYNNHTYITNPNNKIKRTTQYNNEVVKIVPRLYEVYDKAGIKLHFEENPDPLLDTIRITFTTRTELFKASVICFDNRTMMDINNNSIIELPTSCSLIATHII